MTGCLSHAGIVSKRLNLSENIFDLLVAPSFRFFSDPCADTKFQGGPLQREHKIHGVGKFAIFYLNRRLSRP